MDKSSGWLLFLIIAASALALYLFKKKLEPVDITQGKEQALQKTDVEYPPLTPPIIPGVNYHYAPQPERIPLVTPGAKDYTYNPSADYTTALAQAVNAGYYDMSANVWKPDTPITIRLRIEELARVGGFQTDTSGLFAGHDFITGKCKTGYGMNPSGVCQAGYGGPAPPWDDITA